MTHPLLKRLTTMCADREPIDDLEAITGKLVELLDTSLHALDAFRGNATAKVIVHDIKSALDDLETESGLA